MQKGPSGTKIAEQKLVSASAKRSVEQQQQNKKRPQWNKNSGTKIAEQKLVSRTKMAEQKLVGGTKKRSAEQKLVSTVSGTKIIHQVMW